jgi:hypothetical protein
MPLGQCGRASVLVNVTKVLPPAAPLDATGSLSVATTYEHIAESVERDAGKGRLPNPTDTPKVRPRTAAAPLLSLSSGSASDFVASHVLQSLIDCPQPQDLLSA